MSLMPRALSDRRARLASLTAATIALVMLTTAASCDPGTATTHSTTTTGDIPATYATLYKTAPLCPGLDWTVLAAVGKIETNHGRSPLPGVHSGTNSAGAAGPMQFLAGTWRATRKRHPDIGPNIYDPAHAIPAAAHLLCDSGASASIRKALFAYNHSNTYVNDVLAQARRY